MLWPIEHSQANLRSHEATVQAVREAVAQHVPMDIKAVCPKSLGL